MQKISDKARAHTGALLAYMMTAPTRDDLETWWSKRHPVRLELHRLLRDLADDGKLTKDGDAYRVPSQAPAPSPRKEPTMPPLRLPALTPIASPTTRQVTVILAEGKRSVVTLTGSPAAVFAMADAYQCQVAAEAKAAPVTPPPAPVAARKAPPAKPAPRPLTPPAPASAAGRILAALRKKPDDGPGLTRRLKMSPHTVRGRLSELSRAGWIEMDAACRWEVTR